MLKILQTNNKPNNYGADIYKKCSWLVLKDRFYSRKIEMDILKLSHHNWQHFLFFLLLIAQQMYMRFLNDF